MSGEMPPMQEPNLENGESIEINGVKAGMTFRPKKSAEGKVRDYVVQKVARTKSGGIAVCDELTTIEGEQKKTRDNLVFIIDRLSDPESFDIV
jgi:hypothetical protein